MLSEDQLRRYHDQSHHPSNIPPPTGGDRLAYFLCMRCWGKELMAVLGWRFRLKAYEIKKHATG